MPPYGAVRLFKALCRVGGGAVAGREKERGQNMYYLKTSAAFDSAHFLKGYDGKCSNIHGHHWVIEVMVSGEHLQSDGV